MNNIPEPYKLLTIAGSDSGGAAGLQADLKTFTVLGAYGMSVITAVTAQNSVSINAVQMMTPEFVSAQLDAVLSDYGAHAVKTGFIGRVDLIKVIARKIQEYQIPFVVIDPVLVNHKGIAMFSPEVTQAYCEHLFPIATLITPNRFEAALLANTPLPEIATPDWLLKTAVSLQSFGSQAVLIKRGRDGTDSVDLLRQGNDNHFYRTPNLDTDNTHGSGDTLASAIAVFLAQGDALQTAVQKAHHLTAVAIQKAVHWQMGRGHGPLAH